jgi:Protein of unknown function (DUF3159)
MAVELSREESLSSLLGGARAAIDATLPGLAFVAGWLVSGQSIGWGVATALLSGTAVAGLRIRRGDRPRAVLIGLLAVVVASLIALRTGRAADFFLLQIMSNIASALAWMVSIAVRWPLLGVIVGAVLGQRLRWRRDPDLLRAYGLGSWVWVGQYVLRSVVLVALWSTGAVVGLGIARAVLSWPLVAASLAGSWWVVRRTLPPDHPGLRHPQTG